MFDAKSTHPMVFLLGPEERFPLPQQLFHAIILCAFFVASALFVSDLFLHLGAQYYLFTLGFSICFSVLYGYSRNGGNFNIVCALYFAFCLGAIGYGWVVLGGVFGAAPILVVAFSITIPMIMDDSAKKNYFLVVLFGFMALLYMLEQSHPSLISPTENDRTRALDILVSTMVLSTGCFASISFLMKKNLRKRRKLQAMNEELASANELLRERTAKLEQALGEIQVLNQLLPICSHCKKIRDDTGYWIQIEKYFHDHGHTNFSHGICPECAKTFYGECYPPEKDPRESS